MSAPPDSTPSVPTNAAAEEVRRRLEANTDLTEQLRVLEQKRRENDEIISALSEYATWAPAEPIEEEEGDPDGNQV